MPLNLCFSEVLIVIKCPGYWSNP